MATPRPAHTRSKDRRFTLISIERLGKQYRIGARPSLTAGLRWWDRRRAAHGDETIWALDDVHLRVESGTVMGVIGRNGSGKSTLLKILSRITEPTTGRVELCGRVGSLLEVGTGFHPELTGRENIFLNGAILGMSRREIKTKFDEIVDFAGIDRFLDTPVKRYSSGMYVRLGFAVAAHLDPEILLVDEVLAVGDASFRRKCLGKMADAAGRGRTVLFVSHNMTAVLSLCSQCVFLDRGRVVAQGTTTDVVNRYMQTVEQVSTTRLDRREDRTGNQALRLTGVAFRGLDGAPVPFACSGQPLQMAIQYRTSNGQPLRDVDVSIGIHGRFDEDLFRLSSRLSGASLDVIPPVGEFVCTIPALPLRTGRYSFNLFVQTQGEVADWVRNAGMLVVESREPDGAVDPSAAGPGPFVVDHSWTVQ